MAYIQACIGESELGLAREHAEVMVQAKADRAGMSIASLFVSCLVILSKLLSVEHNQLDACNIKKECWWDNSGSGHCNNLVHEMLIALTVVLCVNRCACIMSWAWMAISWDGSLVAAARGSHNVIAWQGAWQRV